LLEEVNIIKVSCIHHYTRNKDRWNQKRLQCANCRKTLIIPWHRNPKQNM